MLTLGDTILSMGTGTRELGKRALLSKDTTQVLRDILSCRVSTKHTNGSGILSTNHGHKTLINRKHLTARAHKKQPGVPGKVINKQNIVSMAPFGSKGSRTPNIRMN
jgi:hypothetical protein